MARWLSSISACWFRNRRWLRLASPIGSPGGAASRWSGCDALVRNSASLFRPQVFVPGLALGIVGWGAVPVVLVLVLNRMGVELELPHAVMICAIASLTGGSTMLPGGGGGTEAAMVLLLRAAEVPLDTAVAATVATRLAFLWLPVGVGLVALPVAIRSVRRREQPLAARIGAPYPEEAA